MRTSMRTVTVMGLMALLTAACGGGAGATTAPTQAPPMTQLPATEAPTDGAPTTTPTEAGSDPTSDPLAFAAQFEGTYGGTWTNTTFGSTGPAEIDVALDRTAGTIEFTITLGGNVFGNPAPKPETLTATLGPGRGLTFTSATFGETSITVDLASGTPVITMSSPDVPSDRIATFTATTSVTDPDTLELEYEVTFRDGFPDAHGTATLTRE